jgi:iron complex outermembrane receptor protein
MGGQIHIARSAGRARRLRESVSYCGLAAALTLGAGNAQAQSAEQTAQAAPAASKEQLEEVVVTARYKQESVQQTPISITALSGDDLEKRGMGNLNEIAKVVPNLKYDANEGQFGNSSAVYIRGIGQYDFDFAFEPGVAVYIDDVYFGTLFGNQLDLSDVSNVSVLRGPQGTLFGRNAEGGAITVDTVEPKGDYSGYVEAGYGSYNHEQFKGAIDVPLIKDELAFRFAVGINNMDGYVDQLNFSCENPSLVPGINAQITAFNNSPLAFVFGKSALLPTSTGGNCKTGELGGGFTGNFHGALAWTPSSDLKIDIKADLLDIRNEQPATTTVYINPNYPGSLVGLAVPGYSQVFLPPNRYSTYEGTYDAKNGYSFPNEDNTTSWGFSGTINYDTPWNIHIKDILAYRYYTGDFGVWAGGSPIPVDNVYNEVSHHQFSEEFQLSGKALDGDLEWVAGAYYYTAYSKYYGLVDLPPLNFLFNQDDPIIDHNTSGFVHSVYHFTDDFSMEAGLRYSTQDKSYSFYRIDPKTGLPVFGFPADGHLGPITTAASRFDPKVEFDYHLNPDAMVYASLATGFKGGGVNPRPANILAVSTFKPEDLTSYEIGEKSEWFGKKLRINADVFAENYKDLQTPFVPVNPIYAGGTLYENIGHVVPYGVEFDYAAQPVPGLQIDGAGGWLHWKVMSLGANVEEQANAPLPGEKPGGIGIPSWKLNSGVQYTWDVDQIGGLIVPRLDWSYTGTEYFGNQHAYTQLAVGGPHIPVPVLARQPGYSVFDASLRFDTADGDWEAMFQVKNLTNEYYYVNAFASLLSLYGNVDVTPSLPRTYFFSIKRIFGPPAPETTPYVPPPTPPAPPPPPPAPAPEAKRSFQVFFDFDKSNITDAAAKVIQAAADAVKAGHVVQITVTGHTDTVGSAAYNQGLSERRAASVKAQLVKDGVAGGEITTIGVGKTGLLVPTADGVREPQNRRAEIVLQ